MATPNTQSANLPESTGKTRHNIVLEADTRLRSERLMELENRSFNNLVVVLIDREYVRQTAVQSKPDEVVA